MALIVSLYFPDLAASANTINLNDGTAYEVAINNETGPLWTLQPAPQNPVYSGGPPFADMPMVVGMSTDVVAETIPVQVMGATHDAVVANLRAIKRAFSTIATHRPAILKVHANTATNATFYEVYSGTVLEGPEFVNLPAPNTLKARTNITLTRRAYGTAATATSLWSGQTFTNNPTAGSPNYRQMTVANGDLIYSGQPMSIEVSAASADYTSSGIKTMWLATLAVAPDNTAPASAISTSSTTGVTAGSSWATTWSNAASGIGVKHRIVAKVGATVANLEMRAIAATTAGGATLWEGDWVGVTAGAYGSEGTYVDLGYFAPPDALRQTLNAYGATIQLYARATTGTATGTVRRIERLSYFTWMKVETSVALTTSYPNILTAWDTGGEQAVRLYQTPFIFFGNSADFPVPRGDAPKAISAAYLYLAWQNANVATQAGTMTVTAKYAPLYHTMRGAG
jgi:hypothetical protein